MSSSSHHITSNRNNRNLQRTGNRSYKSRKREFLGRDIPRSDKAIRDQYNYSDRTPSIWRRIVVMAIILSMVATLIYVLMYHSYLN